MVARYDVGKESVPKKSSSEPTPKSGWNVPQDESKSKKAKEPKPHSSKPYIPPFPFHKDLPRPNLMINLECFLMLFISFM